MKKIERIVLDENEQEIVMDFIALIGEIDKKGFCLEEKLVNFWDFFDEVVEEW